MTRAESADRTDGGSPETEWNVGTATRVITPDRSMRMAGFAARTNPSDGAMMDLHAKAVAFEDSAGTRAVLVSVELLAISRDVRAAVAERVVEYGIDPASLVLTATHTHYGPEYREDRFEVYDLDDDERAKGRAYRERLVDELVGVVAEAVTQLDPAALRYGRARCGIAMNRRLPTPEGIRFEQAPDGPVDLDVPVLAAYRGADPVAIAFGYACHPTCLPLLTEYSGDWVGHAMANLEAQYDGATALFLQGCGGDVKAYPQNTRELSAQHGRALSNSVQAALDAPTSAVRGPLRTVYEDVQLAFEDAPSRVELEATRDSGDEFERRHARLLLARIEEHGSIPTAYPYPIQAIGFGDDLTMVTMGGEVLVEYALKLKDRLAGDVWPVAYSNAGFTYVPTERAVYEGGYEGGGAITYTSFPGPMKPDTEERVVANALALAERVGADRAADR